ncbi:hypothetical protein BLX90_24500 (plasmid) [Rhizobium sp. Y9]|nr:hypothetical protein BLX90_24500 [Rhizobium sp. Y9]
MDAVHPEEQQDVRAPVKRLFATRRSFFLKYRHRRSDGFYRWTNATVQPLLDTDGSIVQWYGVFLDVNDEIETLNALRKSETETRRVRPPFR